MEILIVGQPFCGKSTLFNEVVGYQSVCTSLPGSSAELISGQLDLEGENIRVIDFPSIYSLQMSDQSELPTLHYLLHAPEDAVIVNVIDASVLSRSLELTLQLMELGRPMVLALNMLDEARRKGIVIDEDCLANALHIPVKPIAARKGEGVLELFRTARQIGNLEIRPSVLATDQRLDPVLTKIQEHLAGHTSSLPWSPRLVAIKLLEQDPFVEDAVKQAVAAETWSAIEQVISALEQREENDAEFVVSALRHNQAFRLFESCAHIEPGKRPDIRTRVDALLMHPILGYFFLVAIIYGTFTLIFTVGNTVEPLFLEIFDAVNQALAQRFGQDTLTYSILNGIVAGFGGGIGIVIPYLLPFFVALSLLEDTGYLPRIAYLIDNLMHRIGLHGTSVVPIILGYGCTVPGILATRVLKSPRDRFITATLTTLVPCSARMTIIFGLVGFFISMKAAVFIYVFNVVLIMLVGKTLSAVMPEVSPGLIMEIPRYHIPDLKVLVRKTWFRLKEFVVIAWPLLVVGSVVLEVIDFFHLAAPINGFLAPFTTDVLGLPAAVGITLLFGILRKELALILLFGALGTSDVGSVMTETQMLSFTFFVTFYVPCLATVAALAGQLNWARAMLISLLTVLIAIALAVGVRTLAPLMGLT